MPVDEIIKKRITGIVPIDELAIDSWMWTEAHSQHLNHQYLHAVTSHRPGIVFGMEAMVDPKDGNRVVIAPGVAVDADGRTILLAMAEPFMVAEKGSWYIIAEYSEVLDAKHVADVGGTKHNYRLVEACRVSRVKELPKTPYIELARVEKTKVEKTISMPANPMDPGPDELNLLYRQNSLPFCQADGVICELSYVSTGQGESWKPNRAGIIGLVRESATFGYHLGFGGPVPAGGLAAQKPLMVYMAGESGMKELNGDQLEGIKAYLAAGGVLMGEGLSDKGGFAKSFETLAKQLGAKLEEVKQHELLNNPYIFPAFPSGVNDSGRFLMDSNLGIILSTYNYGGAWGGGVTSKSVDDARTKTRYSLEIGMNIASYAAKRRRTLELTEMLGNL